MSVRAAAPLVAVLAGGRGERLGGNKPTTELAGRPLISYPLAAAADAGLDAIVIAKSDTVLPPLRERVVYDDEPLHHPLAGVLAALKQSDTVIALACDMPFVPGTMLRWIAEQSALSVVTRAGSFVQPFPALYRKRHIRSLQSSMLAQQSMRATIEHLRPQIVDERDLRAFGSQVRLFFSVNTPADLQTAENWLQGRQPAATRQA
jgi:molybdopterin-guanine dinucleotide biosynthesis protein A